METLFTKSETDPLYCLIRTMEITNIASYIGMKARDIITHSKCELCRNFFNSPETLTRLRAEVSVPTGSLAPIGESIFKIVAGPDVRK